MKRAGYISWDEYFMGVAQLAGMRSKDPNTQVGSCIVSREHKILSIGYNGMPRGCSDDEFPWEREGETLMTKYPFVTHSELNAILNYRGGSLEGPCMSPCSPATSVQRPSSRRGFTRSFTRAINTTVRTGIRRASGCSGRPGCSSSNIRRQDAVLPFICRQRRGI